MSTEIRTNGDYDIIGAVRVSENSEIVLGAKPKDYRHPDEGYGEYVVWNCAYGNMYSHGVYFISYAAALRRLANNLFVEAANDIKNAASLRRLATNLIVEAANDIKKNG